jgi:hypothetical protein
MRSKGIDIPLTPTAQLEIMPEEELILAETIETVTDVPPAAETRKKTTQKQLITMSMLPRRTRRKTTSKRKTPTSKQRTPSKKTPTPTSKRSYDMRTIRTYNTRKRTQATQAGLD